MNAEWPPKLTGAYGFRVVGIDHVDGLVDDVPARWPALTVRTRIHAGPEPEHDEVVDTGALIRMRSGGWVNVERATGRATFSLRSEPTAAALVHPHLAAAVTVSAYWLGRESFHAGGLGVDGGVWGVLGEKLAGKSTLLATAVLAGLPIVTDDILVLDDRAALAGPRCIDLRQESAEQLGAGDPLGRIGDRERWRLRLPQIAPELPLRGWISLRWGDHVRVEPVRGAERLRRIAGSRGFGLAPTNPGELIELSALPMLELVRPARWDAAAAALDCLLDAVAGAG